MEDGESDQDYEAAEENNVKIPKKVKKQKFQEKKKKSKKKAQKFEVECSDNEMSPENISLDVKHEMNHSLTVGENEEVPNSTLEETIDWPQQDFQELVKRMEMVLPQKDNLAYGTRVEKLNWDELAFNTYSGEQCKKAWFFIQKKVRRYRLLVELLQDAKDILTNSWVNFIQKHKRHPDMPKRPLTSYLLFYMKKKDKILAENPGIELPEISKKIGLMFKTISDEKKEKYMKLAIEERKKYEIKLEEFYQNHPEVSRNAAGAKTLGPKKPQTPFGLYYENQIKVSKREDDFNSFKEQCRDNWKNLSDKKKLLWIDKALENEVKYQEELKEYILHNPHFVPAATKPVLNKEEKLLKDKFLGKPKKPPSSAYSLFSQMMMRSEDIKKIDVKFRIKAIAEQWSFCSQEEKQRFKEHADYLQNKYKEEYINYLASLPEDKRQNEIDSSSTKRKKLVSEDDNDMKKQTKKKSKAAPTSSLDENDIVPKEPPNIQETIENVNKNTVKRSKKKNAEAKKDEKDVSEGKSENDILKVLEAEPPTPPMSGFDLFSTRYHGKAPLEVAWRKMNKQDKKEYQMEVELIKEEYIKKYEQFLKSLSKEQLTIYSQLKKKARAEQVSEDSSSNNGD